MGSLTFDFLSNSFLFNDEGIVNNYSKYTNKQVENELDKYHRYVLDKIDKLDKEISNNRHGIKVFSGYRKQPEWLIKQNALHVDTFVIQDPLFNFNPNRLVQSDVIGKFFGIYQGEVSKHDVASTCRYLKKLSPMIAGNYLKIYPISDFTETKWLGEFSLSNNYAADVLPHTVKSFFDELVRVKNVTQAKNGAMSIHIDQALEISRRIHISFGDTPESLGMIFFLTDTIFTKDPNDENLVQFVQQFPDTPPSKQEFDTWVDQSIYSSAFELYSNTIKEYSMSERFNATYLTTSDVKSKLLGVPSNQHSSIQNFALSTSFAYEAPYLDKIDIDKLMHYREYDSDLLTTFRLEFEKSLRDLKNIDDQNLMRSKMESVQHELFDVQTNKINRQIKQYKKQVKTTAAIAMGSLIPTFLASPTATIGGLIIAGLKGFKDYNKYKEVARQNPSYILWKSRIE